MIRERERKISDELIKKIKTHIIEMSIKNKKQFLKYEIRNWKFLLEINVTEKIYFPHFIKL